MNTVVDIILVVFLILGTWIGTRKGLIKSAVSLIGLVAIVILSYSLKSYLANFLIDFMPFFNFSGALEGLTSLNVLIYNAVAFVLIFILMYCILNIIISLTGFIDTLLKFTVIWIIPSKIGGAIIGFLESWVFLFLAVFVLSQFSVTNSFVDDSKVGDFILNHTPIVGEFLSNATNAAQEIFLEIETSKDDKKTLNLSLLQIAVNNNLITAEKSQELIDIGKISLDGVFIVRPKWEG